MKRAEERREIGGGRGTLHQIGTIETFGERGFYPLTLVTLVDVLQYLFFLEEFTFFFPLLVVSSLQGHCE